jgi:hypothetical protein
MVVAGRIAHRDRQSEEAVVSTTHRVSTSAVLVFSLAAAAAPGAVAPGVASANPAPAVYSPQDKALVRPQRPADPPAGVYNRQDKSLLPHNYQSTPGLAKAGKVNSSQPVVRVETPKGGFDWGDAGVGAVGGLALSLIALGGALAISQRRARRTRDTRAASS